MGIRVRSGNRAKIDKLLAEAGFPDDAHLVEQPVDDEALEAELLLDDAIEEEAAIAEETEEASDLTDEGDEDDDVEDGDGEEAAAEDYLLVELAPGCDDDEALEAEIRRTAVGGGTVIAVWPEGTPMTRRVPEIIERLGSAVLHWSPERLAAAIRRGDLSWHNPDGTYREGPKRKRNKC